MRVNSYFARNFRTSFKAGHGVFSQKFVHPASMPRPGARMSRVGAWARARDRLLTDRVSSHESVGMTAAQGCPVPMAESSCQTASGMYTFP
jgi:hypothetical protein